jgi:hypothetical protein
MNIKSFDNGAGLKELLLLSSHLWDSYQVLGATAIEGDVIYSD